MIEEDLDFEEDCSTILTACRIALGVNGVGDILFMISSDELELSFIISEEEAFELSEGLIEAATVATETEGGVN